MERTDHPTMRHLLVLTAVLMVLGTARIPPIAAHEPDRSPSLAAKEGIAAPLLPVAPPRKQPIHPGMALHTQIRDALDVAMEYRRLMDYLLLLAQVRDLVSHSISAEHMGKALQILVDFEGYALQVNLALEAHSRGGSIPTTTDRPRLLSKFGRRFQGLREELDHQTRKHYEPLGIPLVKVTGAGIACDRKAIRLKALAGSQTAIFILLGESQEPGRWTVRMQRGSGVSAEGDRRISLPALPGGFVPCSLDEIAGRTRPASSVSISYRPEDPGREPMSLTLPLDIEVVQPSRLDIECTDQLTGQLLACRMQVKDRYGVAHAPLGARVTQIPWSPGEGEWNAYYRYPGEEFFYGKGRIRLTLPPGRVALRALHGFEYSVYEHRLDLSPGEAVHLRVPMERWIDMPLRGWRCGQTHMHSLDLMPVNDHSDWEIVPEAEGLDVSYLLTYQQSGEVFTDQYPIGPLHHLSRPNRILSVGEEFRHFTRGHMTFNGLQRLVEPISPGMLGGKGHYESPSGAEAIREAHGQGAVAAYAHLNSMSGFISSEELPIDAALGLVDAGEVMGTGGGYKYWYSLLNCGIRVGATAGPDWDLEDCCRVYVNLGGRDFTERNWLHGLRKHHTFVTTGPMLFLTVNGQGPGATISGSDARELSIRAEALSALPIDRLELIANAQVIATKEPETDDEVLQLETVYRPPSNGWIAARCFGEGNAHTSAVYIRLNDKPVHAFEDAKLLRGFALKALRDAERSENYPSRTAKQKVIETFREGIAYYNEIIKRGKGTP